jgi:superfamily II DNA/RNA helicase
VNVLWPPDEEKGGQSALFVVGDASGKDENSSDETHISNDSETSVSPGRLILRSIPNCPIIAGTPKMLRMLYREAERVDRCAKSDSTILDKERTTSKALITNIRAIVLDEADRLLRTEAVAREAAERKERKIAKRMAEESEDDTSSKKKRLIIARETQTELLLRDLPIPSLGDVQIICASATVGRTMRRQLMQILDVPSADAAATLVTGDDDARVKSKDSEKRRSVLLPEQLRHSYQVVDIMSEGVEELSELSVADQTEERMIRATVKSLRDTMGSLEPKPMLIFPGKIGVERIQQELISMGLRDVRALRNLDGTSQDNETNNSGAPGSSPWQSVPVYVIGERFARGLDLPNVEYVVILSPPSSAAGYAHMAGRTGRSGKSGTAITFVRPKNNEVKRFVAIAETLRVKFSRTNS